MYDEIREAFEIQKAEAPARPVIQRKTIENGEEDPSDFSDVADADVDAFVLSAEEARKKAEMWERMNEDYINRQEEKNKLREAREQAQAQGQPPPGKKPKPRKKSSKKMARLGNQTAAEAVLDVVEKKRFSKKINYTVLQGIFGGQKKRKSTDSPGASKKMKPIAEEEEDDDDDGAPEVPGTTI